MLRVFAILCFHLFLSSRGALYGFAQYKCLFTSEDNHHPVYKAEIIFNKGLVVDYNSTSNKCVGHTKFGEFVAAILNRNQHFMANQKNNAQICHFIPDLYYTLLKTVEPNVRVHSVEAEEGERRSVLVCSATSFYPEEINLTWQKNGENVTSGVTNTDVLSNGNWLHQMHSFLDYTPKYGETITCVVEHISLDQPILKNWEPLTEQEKLKIALGSFGIVMGIGVFLAGLIYYINKPGRTLVPS